MATRAVHLREQYGEIKIPARLVPSVNPYTFTERAILVVQRPVASSITAVDHSSCGEEGSRPRNAQSSTHSHSRMVRWEDEHTQYTDNLQYAQGTESTSSSASSSAAGDYQEDSLSSGTSGSTTPGRDDSRIDENPHAPDYVSDEAHQHSQRSTTRSGPLHSAAKKEKRSLYPQPMLGDHGIIRLVETHPTTPDDYSSTSSSETHYSD